MILLPFLTAALVTGQPITSVPGPDHHIMETHAAGFEELTNGRTEAAITLLQAELQAHPGDPSLLLNLGSAYLRLGRTAGAVAAFDQAAKTRVRYELELADGRWIDSRQAARIARAGLPAGAHLASR